MKKITKTINNEQGFVLIASLMMLMVLMVIGVVATNTTTIELQISGNDKLAKQTFYQAESVVGEAVTSLEKESASINLDAPPKWLSATGILVPGVTESTDVFDETICWLPPSATAPNSKASISPSLPRAEMMGIHRRIAPGSSIIVGEALHDYDLYGRSQKNDALVIIRVGYRINI